MVLTSCHSPAYQPTAKAPKLYYLSSRAASHSGDILHLKDHQGSRRRGQIFDLQKPLLASDTLDAEAFAQNLRADLRPRFPGEKVSVLVYIHGFATGMTSAGIATQRLAGAVHDYTGGQSRCVPVLHSWPSSNNFMRYSHDRNQVDMAAMDMAHFLTELSSAKGGQPMDIVAHSMGCEVLLKALMAVQARHQAGAGQVNIRRIVLAAPDVESTKFDELLLIALGLKPKPVVTIYTSRHDLAMAASRTFANQGLNRAGRPITRKTDSSHYEIRSPGVGRSGRVDDPVPLSHVEVVDVSGLYEADIVEKGFHRLNVISDVGHFYHESPPVIRDITRFLTSGLPAAKRGLEPRSYHPGIVQDTQEGDARTRAPFTRQYHVFPKASSLKVGEPRELGSGEPSYDGRGARAVVRTAGGRQRER